METTVEMGYCDQCYRDVAVADAGSGPGYYASIAWVSFACGHTMVDDPAPQP